MFTCLEYRAGFSVKIYPKPEEDRKQKVANTGILLRNSKRVHIHLGVATVQY